MGKNGKYNGNKRFDDPDVNQVDRLPTDEEIGDVELNVRADENVFVPNPLVYNTHGISPTTVTYRIMMKDLKRVFTQICKDQIDGVNEVTAQFDPEIGEVQFLCNFHDNCRHFNDDSLKGTMLSDHKTQYYSKDVKAFAKKFGLNPMRDCVTKNGHLVGEMGKMLGKNANGNLNASALFIRTYDRSTNTTHIAMRLSWTTLVRLVFDADGNAFNKQYGKRPARCSLNAHFEFKKQDSFDFGRIQYLEVVKTLRDGLDAQAPRPKLAFNYREA